MCATGNGEMEHGQNICGVISMQYFQQQYFRIVVTFQNENLKPVSR